METAVARTSTKGKRKSKRQIKQEQTNTNKQNHEKKFWNFYFRRSQLYEDCMTDQIGVIQ